MSERTAPAVDEVYFAEVTKARFGYSIQVCFRPARLPGPGIYSVVEAREAMTGGGIDTSWIVMDVDRPHWRLTSRWAEHKARRLVKRYTARAMRQATVVTIET